MSKEPTPRCIPLSDVVDPDQFRLEVASVELSALRDDQILAAQLDAPDLSRARQILARAGGLNPLTRMGLSDHRALDLSATESARLLVMQGLAARLIDRRTETRQFTTAQALGDEIAIRSLEFREQETIGIIGTDHRGIRTLDRVMYIGTANSSFLHPREIIREALRMDVVAMVLWTWQPYPDPAYDESLKKLVHEIRMLGDVTGARLWDALIVGEMQAVSIRTLEQWVD